jgi:hypothetical protein
MDVRQRRQFYEALLDADAFEDLPGSRRPQSWLNFAFAFTATLAASVQA